MNSILQEEKTKSNESPVNYIFDDSDGVIYFF